MQSELLEKPGIANNQKPHTFLLTIYFNTFNKNFKQFFHKFSFKGNLEQIILKWT